MLIPLIIALGAGYWYTHRVGTPTLHNLFPTKPNTHEDRLRAVRDPEKVYDLTGKRTLEEKKKIGAVPFQGQTRNQNPRVAPPYVAPVPKNAHKIDWRSPTASSLFKNPAYQAAHKRIHQMVYGTPTAQARRGQLQVDWGYSPDKGYPIPRGRTQSWLPSNYSIPYPHSGIAPENKSLKVNHFDLLGKLIQHSNKKEVPIESGSEYVVSWQ